MTFVERTVWTPEPCDLSASPWLRIGQRIRELRIDAEMTQGELAQRCGVERPHVNRWEHGKHTLSIETLVRAAAGLEIELEVLTVVLDERWCASARVIERALRERPPLVAARRRAA